MVEPALRDYRIPAFADVPRNEIYLADTCDSIGPLGRKHKANAQSIASRSAIANAVADATTDLPLTPDRIFSKLAPRTQ
jgi:putative selenate reductase molybdopterin-binding subunit